MAKATLEACELATTALTNDFLDADFVRAQFPSLLQHPDLLFFDNGATTQKPQSVIETINGFYRDKCANAGRAAYSWATQLSGKVEDSRAAVASLINANPNDIAFTNGATDSLNLVASSWGMNNLKDGDEIMLCLDDHASATLPWFNVQAQLRRFGIEVAILPFDIHSSGTYDRKSLIEKLSSRTKIIVLSHIHHLYGMEMDLPELRQSIPGNISIGLDASQSIGHTEVDVQKLGADFVSFSGHKMFAANGTGVLWVCPERREQMWPSRLGAKSAVHLSADGLVVDRSSLSGLVECGTLNLPGILSYAPAVDFIESLGITNIEKHLSLLTHYLHGKLKRLSQIDFAPGLGSCNCTKGYGIISFKFAGFPSSDLAAYLDSENIFVRTGDYCLGAGKKDDDYTRVSLHIYNTLEEIDHFVEVLKDAAG